METCTVETGLLKKKPCGEASVTHCVNCEQPLCSKHAVPQLGAGGRKTGKFLCKECAVAQREHDKAVGATDLSRPAPSAAKPAHAPAQKAPAPTQKAPAPTPAADAPAKAGAAEPAQPAPAAAKEEKFKLEDTGPIEFTPTKKP